MHKVSISGDASIHAYYYSNFALIFALYAVLAEAGLRAIKGSHFLKLSV